MAASQSPSASPGLGEHEEAQGRHADNFFKEFLSCRAQLSPPGPTAKPGERGDVQKEQAQAGGTLQLRDEGFL